MDDWATWWLVLALIVAASWLLELDGKACCAACASAAAGPTPSPAPCSLGGSI
jgi:hypothetical protein